MLLRENSAPLLKMLAVQRCEINLTRHNSETEYPVRIDTSEYDNPPLSLNKLLKTSGPFLQQLPDKGIISETHPDQRLRRVIEDPSI